MSTAERLSRGEDVGVDVAAIEREFASLWREAGADQPGTQKAVTRACLANLVVWVEREELLTPLKAAFDQLVVTVPARVLVVQIENTAEGKPEFESFISANCILAPGGGKLVCSEEVTLVARGEGRAHTGSVVRALLVANVPTMCLLPVPAAHATDTFRGLLPLADRLLVDSGALATPAGFKLLAMAVQRVPAVVDLGWEGLRSFRSALASVFDHAVPRRALDSLHCVRLKAPTARLANRLLLIGWLADRLGWKDPCPGADGAVTYAGKQGAVVVEIESIAPSEGDPEPDTVLSLCTRDGDVKLTRGAEPLVAVESLGHPARHMALDPSTLGERIARGMGPLSVDPLYARVFKRTLELVDLLPS